MKSKQNKKKTFQTKRFHTNIGKSNEEIRSRLRGVDVGQPRSWTPRMSMLATFLANRDNGVRLDW